MFHRSFPPLSLPHLDIVYKQRARNVGCDWYFTTSTLFITLGNFVPRKQDLSLDRGTNFTKADLAEHPHRQDSELHCQKHDNNSLKVLDKDKLQYRVRGRDLSSQGQESSSAALQKASRFIIRSAGLINYYCGYKEHYVSRIFLKLMNCLIRLKILIENKIILSAEFFS